MELCLRHAALLSVAVLFSRVHFTFYYQQKLFYRMVSGPSVRNVHSG